MSSLRLIVPMLFALTALTACSKASEPTIPDNTSAMLTQYAAIASASYDDTLKSAQALDASIDAFTMAPDAPKLAAARKAWLDAREPYLQTEVYRFYGGPIDGEDGPEGLLNAWPLDEAYIDYVEGNAGAGVIQDESVEISVATLEQLNEQGGEENISTGYHAIEFLLWGQDTDPEGPGDRPVTDYLEPVGGSDAAVARRKAYLEVVSELLVAHLQQVATQWEPGQQNYRAEFVAAPPAEGLRKVLTGMIILSGFETGGERLQTALDSGDQEDEHSCFSDNTHRDMIQDIQGVQNVFLGSYTRTNGEVISGTGVKDVIAARDPELAASIESQIAQSLMLAGELQTPFDQEIAQDNAQGRARVEALIVSLRKQEDLLEDAFRLFELDIPVAE